jgi:hypothetical protein
MFLAAVWSVGVWWRYFKLIARKNWARLALAVLTFPTGLMLGLSQEARMYYLQEPLPNMPGPPTSGGTIDVE